MHIYLGHSWCHALVFSYLQSTTLKWVTACMYTYIFNIEKNLTPLMHVNIYIIANTSQNKSVLRGVCMCTGVASHENV